MNQSNTLTAEQNKQLAETFRPGENMNGTAVQRFIKQDEVQSVANQQLSETLLAKGINLDFILDERAEILRLTKKEKQYNVSLRALEGFEELAGLRNKVKVTQKQSFNYGNLLPEEEKQQIEAKNSGKPSREQDS